MDKNMVLYKPGLTMDTPVSVTMAAADWAVFMSWTIDPHNTDPVSHLIRLIGIQVQEALFDQPSIKAAVAQAASMVPHWNPLARVVFGFPTQIPDPEDFMEENNDDEEDEL